MEHYKKNFRIETWKTEDLLLIWEFNGDWLESFVLHADYTDPDSVDLIQQQWSLQSQIFNELVKRQAL